jgi:hypothetical protein
VLTMDIADVATTAIANRIVIVFELRMRPRVFAYARVDERSICAAAPCHHGLANYLDA